MVLTPLVQTAAVPTHDTAPSQSDYTITLDDGKTRIVTFEDLTQEASPTNPASATIPEAFEGLPHFLYMGSKITMDHTGIFHKGFLGYIKEGNTLLISDTIQDQPRLVGLFHCHNLNRIGLTWWVRILSSPGIPQSAHFSSQLHPTTRHLQTSFQPRISLANAPLPSASPQSLQQR